jgi:trans-aconitate methyltransferase
MKWNSGLYDNKHSFVAEYGKNLLEFIPSDTHLRILDLGCGTGTLTRELSMRCDYVLGIDASDEMIEKAREHFPDIDFEVLDALKLPFNKEWDIVFSNAVIHWINDHDLLLNKIYNSLKPGGKLICEFGAKGNIETIEQGFASVLNKNGYAFNSKFNFATVDKFETLLQKNSFIIDEIYDYDRPTKLNDGEQGLSNWARQFLASDLQKFSVQEQDVILNELQDLLKDKLWNGKEWVADYRRIRVIAHIH